MKRCFENLICIQIDIVILILTIFNYAEILLQKPVTYCFMLPKYGIIQSPLRISVDFVNNVSLWISFRRNGHCEVKNVL